MSAEREVPYRRKFRGNNEQKQGDGANTMSLITFADLVHQSISFDESSPAGKLVLELIDTRWVQRLRDISQTANTRLVFMFSEHSRFGHSLGVAYMAQDLMEKLSRSHNREIKPWKPAVSAAAILHDIGHIAPGSHTAYKTWFPEKRDGHESLVKKIIDEDESLRSILMKFDPELPGRVVSIIEEDKNIPAWTWELISGGGWNVDRGNWCVVDSILAGVSYGKYNIPALTESVVLTDDGHIALRENRLDAMMHFAVSRHAMYRQLYQHRVLLAADTLNSALVMRARDVGGGIDFCDRYMSEVLRADSVEELSLETLYNMRESWWRYHVYRWCEDKDPVLSDLSRRITDRRLFKTVRVQETDDEKQFREEASRAVSQAGFDPRYYLHEVRTFDMHGGDSRQSMKVLMDTGTVRELFDAEPLFESLVKESRSYQKLWLVMPEEAKEILGRTR